MRQFVPAVLPKEGVLMAAGADYNHLARVLRVKAGDMIDVRLPDGRLVPATVCQVDSKKGIVVMQECEVSAAGEGVCTPPFDITLFQFIARPQKMEVIVRQAVECAVKTVLPIRGAYSQAGYVAPLKSGPTARMERIIKEAMEQSGAAFPLEVTSAMSVEEAIAWWKDRTAGKNTAAVVLSERNAPAPYDALKDCRLSLEEGGSIALAVGPEGGIAPKEEELLNKAGFASVHFACNIMRCETAALYGVAMLRTWMEGRNGY